MAWREKEQEQVREKIDRFFSSPGRYLLNTGSTLLAASPDRRERQLGTLVRALGAGAAPTVTTGHTVTRLLPCSSANLLGAFSTRAFDTGYP